MDFNIVEQIFEFATNLSDSQANINLVQFIFLIGIAIIVSYGKELSDSKLCRKEFNKSEFIYQILIGIMLSILTVYGTKINIILSSIIGSIGGLVIHDKLFNINIDTTRTVNESNNDNPIKLQIQERLKLLSDKEYYDILDILLIYEYISFNQYDKIVKSFIYSTPEEMAEKLPYLQALTEKELKEAKALINVIRIKGRLITKDELIEFIEQINNE